jgi:hypothetical protein
VSDEEIRKLLEAALLLEDSPVLTDSAVDSLMSTPEDVLLGTLEQGRARVAGKVLDGLHPEPVRHIEENLSFGRWIEKIRKKAHLTHKFIDAALNKESSFIERLETGDILPWELTPTEGVDIAILFRIHVNAFMHLLEISLAVNKERAKGEAIAART